MLFVYPDSFETKVGFDVIRLRLEAECLGPAGRAYCQQSRISTKASVVTVWQDQVAQYQQLLTTGRDLLAGTYPDMDLLALRLEIEGNYLAESELHAVRKLLVAIENIIRFRQAKNIELYPQLARIAASVSSLAGVLVQINQVLNDAGAVKESASTELQRLRKAMTEEQRALRKRLDSILRQALSDGHAPDGAEITIRNGRLVIPIVAEAKRKVRGFVHDESATGQTVFMEPADVLDSNNRVRELEYEARREIQRILLSLTNALRAEREALDAGYEAVSLLDFIRAKARVGMATNATRPLINQDGVLKLRQARNPVLEEVLARQGRKVVPLDIDLSPERRMLVISGPNAGGKSAALKTVALMQYMGQFGLPLPAADGTSIPIFEKFLVDIGDDQSLENDLSTYSSHLAHMRRFLETANERSLLFIDEFGTGTDPAYGGPIAMAVLQELNKKQAYGVFTTHYSAIKDLSAHTAGLDNGSMRFDVVHLSPLYELQTGKPGSSFALEVAQKIGLPAGVLTKARQLVGKTQLDLDSLLISLEGERNAVETLKKQVSEQKQLTEKLRKEYEEITAYLASNRAGLMRQAKDEARALVQDANRKIEETIRQIREADAEKERTKSLRKDLVALNTQLELSPEEVATPTPVPTGKKAIREAKKKQQLEPVILSSPIAEGDTVRLKGTEVPATVISVKGNQVRIQAGAFSSTIRLDQLEKLDKNSLQKAPVAATQGVNLNDRMMSFTYQLDVRGLYAGDAMTQVEEYLDDALLLGVQEVRILHGKGNGILKTQIRNQLRAYPQVVHMGYDHADRGGEGITIVTLA